MDGLNRNMAAFTLPDGYVVHTLYEDLHLQNGRGRVIPRGSQVLVGGTHKKPERVVKRGKHVWSWEDSGRNRVVASWKGFVEDENIHRIAILDYQSLHATTEGERGAKMKMLRGEFT